MSGHCAEEPVDGFSERAEQSVHNHLQRRMDDGRMSHGKLHKLLVSAASIPPAETAGRARRLHSTHSEISALLSFINVREHCLRYFTSTMVWTYERTSVFDAKAFLGLTYTI
jgi:hypothetical protein